MAASEDIINYSTDSLDSSSREDNVQTAQANKDFTNSTDSSSREDNVQSAEAQADKEEADLRPTIRKEGETPANLISSSREEGSLKENQLDSSSSSTELKLPLRNQFHPSFSREEGNLLLTAEQENQLDSSSSGELKLPLGYHFRPDDDILIVDYLIPRILGAQLPAKVMEEIDVYRFDPEILLNSQFKYVHKGEVYFFSKQMFNVGARITPTEKGCWKASGEDVEVRNKSKEIVGYKKTLIYYKGKEGEEENTNWTMYEYRVSPNMMVPDAEKHVACRIKYKEASKEENEEIQSDHFSSSSSSSKGGEEDETVNESLGLTLNDL